MAGKTKSVTRRSLDFGILTPPDLNAFAETWYKERALNATTKGPEIEISIKPYPRFSATYSHPIRRGHSVRAKQLETDELHAAILRSTILRRVRRYRPGFSISFGAEPGAVDAVIGQPIHDGIRALFG